jgi:lipoprotein-anchoring transpeptidase ErfK/SrfK
VSSGFHISRGLKVGVIAAVIGLLVLAVAAWAYDNSREDQIASGITVGGVDVGGRSVDEARPLIEEKVVDPLARPLTVTYHGDQKADIEGMLDEALEESREGGFGGRLVRYASGGEVNHDIEPRVSYSKKRVSEFVDELAAEIDQEPQDARLIPSGDTLTRQAGEYGLSLQQKQIRRQINDRIQSPLGQRVVAARVARVKPEVTKRELREAYPTYITIDRGSYTLRLFKDLKLVESYPIAVGAVGYDTPSGLYDIETKEVNPTWHVPESDWTGGLAGQSIPPGPSNPLKARWMGIIGGNGIHGTDDVGSLGTSASHGCIRMSVPEVIELFDRVEVGDPVYII